MNFHIYPNTWSVELIVFNLLNFCTGHLTLADICFVASYSTIVESGVFDFADFPELNEWFEKCKALIPNYEKANGEGATGFGGWFKNTQATKKAAA